MQYLKENRNILIIVIIALVNMLGYGIIIPILYTYSLKFGLSDFQNGLLVAIYSICQFISTPIIGKLSDKFGRRPMLIISLIGTALSFFMMAFTPSAIFLFIARALDGLTAGNIPVALAVVSDSTKTENRAKAFGLVGAAFSVGFVFGPVTAALTAGLGSEIPFIIAGIISIIAAIITFLYLPETNKNIGVVMSGKLFDFKKMFMSLFDGDVGVTFLITLIFYLAFGASIVYGFSPFTTNILGLSASGVAGLFVIFGVVGLIAQTLLVDKSAKRFGLKKSLTSSIIATALALAVMGISNSVPVFIIGIIIMGVSNSIAQTLITTILSNEVDEKSQGSVMGLNQSYQSLGFIVGPIVGGILATAISIRFTFIVGALLLAICVFLSFKILENKRKLSID